MVKNTILVQSKKNESIYRKWSYNSCQSRSTRCRKAADRIIKKQYLKIVHRLNTALLTTDCITEINNSKDLHVVMPMYNLIEYSDNYSETFGNLYLFCRDEPNNIITDFKSKVLDNTDNEGNINPKIAVQLNNLSNFWRTLERHLINCEINLLVLTCKLYNF